MMTLMDRAICEMYTSELETELSARQFELLDPSLSDAYRRWCCDRIEALLLELSLRDIDG